MAELVDSTGGNITSVMTFESVQGSIHNNTLVECTDFDGESENMTIVMAGTCIPLISATVYNI